MPRWSEPVLRFLQGPGPALLLALAWPTLRTVRSGAMRHRAAPAAPTWRGDPAVRSLAALSLVGALQLLSDLVLRLADIAHWQAPADRLLGGMVVVAIVIAVRPAFERSTIERAVPAFLAGSAAMAVAWLASAPGWAAAARAGAASATSRAVLADVVLATGTLALALAIAGPAVARTVARTVARPRAVRARTAMIPHHPLVGLGMLALGSALQAIWPMPAAAALWRAGVLAAGAWIALAVLRGEAAAMRTGTAIVAQEASAALEAAVKRASTAVARTSTAVARTSSIVAGTAIALASSGRAVADGAQRRARAAWRAVRTTGARGTDAVGPGRPGASARARLALAGAMGRALGEALKELDAAVVYAGLVEDEAVRFWALTPSGALQELYRRPLTQLAAVKRALQSGDGALGSRTEARDVDDLYGHLGLPFDGPILLAAGGRPTRVVLVAGSAYGPWRRDDPAKLAASAAALAHRLAGLDEPVAPPQPAAPAATADDIARLRAEVAALHGDVARFGSRLDGIERRVEGHPVLSDALAGAAQMVPAPATSYLARVEAHQRLIEPLPWGVVVCDADGRVILANTAARRLLVGAALLPGHRIDIPGPGARTLVHSLRDASSTLQGGRVPLHAMDTVVRVEPIDRPNWRHRNRLGATLVVTTTADAAAGSESILVDLLDALRDPLVDLRLQGESLDAEVRMPVPDLMRHLAVLDGHAAGLRAVLGALAAQRSLATHRHRPELGAVDIGVLGATTERSLRDLFALRGIRFRGVRGIVPSDVTVDVRLLEHVALAVVTGAVATASWGSHLSVHVRHEAIVPGDPASAIVVVIDLLDGGLTPMTPRRLLDEATLASHPAALRVGHALAARGFPGCEAWFTRRTPEDQRVQLCLRLPVGRAA